MSPLQMGIVVSRVIMALEAGDDAGAVEILGQYDPEDRLEILATAAELGRIDPARIEVLKSLLGTTEVIEVVGTVPGPARGLPPWAIALTAAGGAILGMFAQTRVGARFR